MVTWSVGAAVLPGLDLTQGVPEQCRTLVAVPTLLSSKPDLLADIETLEVHYLSGSGDERKWMGWERKRGKLHELNRLLGGAVDTTYVPVDGLSQRMPVGVRYVITLDSDTRLPRDAAQTLVGKMAHPLNWPGVVPAASDPTLKRVIHGHAILQPRVTPSVPMRREGSAYQCLYSSPAGLDPYPIDGRLPTVVVSI